MQYLLQLKNVTKLYRNNKGISNVNLNISEGKIISIIGKSGVGKTTLLKTIINKVKRTKGEILYYGEKLNQNFKHIVREIGYVPQNNIKEVDMTVKELLLYTMSFYNVDYEKEIDTYLRQFQLESSANVSTLSQGELRILAFINAVYHKPRLLILDEITTGIDEYNKRLIKDILIRFKANNCSIIMTSHDLNFINQISDNIYYIANNELLELDSKFSKPNYKLVNITTSKYYEYKDIKLPEISNLNINNTHISFMYTGKSHNLLKFLSSLNITDLSITNPNINDILEDIAYEDKTITNK